ncbi:unnamed protein product [Oppiella nova]|uniref:Uncharacterized protein n=1 Tax=Oppiella nova TaxID=334625 RepID=A0A7R9QLG2_9ACAR|nr:unnamed protein product [Oppiella nova]CAG2168332.1 unnamed protein product [Oppiella nova]
MNFDLSHTVPLELQVTNVDSHLYRLANKFYDPCRWERGLEFMSYRIGLIYPANKKWPKRPRSGIQPRDLQLVNFAARLGGKVYELSHKY